MNTNLSRKRKSVRAGGLSFAMTVAIGLVDQLGETAWYRDPNTWPRLFEDASSKVDGASDLPRAQALVKEGREALAKDDNVALRWITEKLWKRNRVAAVVTMIALNSAYVTIAAHNYHAAQRR